jgi:hypothetical protein
MMKLQLADKAWLGGVVSCFGVLTHTHHVMPVPRLQLRSSKHPGMIAKVARLTGMALTHKKVGDEVNFTGEAFTMFYNVIFPFLTDERLDEFGVLIREVEHIRKEYQDLKKYEAERAAEPHSTPDSIRHREEALYHNQDPAIQVVEGFVDAEMATSYDLEQARIQREKAQQQMTAGQIRRSK